PAVWDQPQHDKSCVPASPALDGEQSKRLRKPSRTHPPRRARSALDKAGDPACAPPRERPETTGCRASSLSRPLHCLASSGAKIHRWRPSSGVGFQLAHSSDPSFRIVGRNNDKLRALSVCASSTHATSKPSSDLIDSAVESCIP